GDVVDQLLDQHGLADAGAAVEADLTTTGQGGDEVDDLDAGLEDLRLGLLLLEARGLTVDRHALAFDRAHVVQGRAEHVEQAAERAGADGNGDRPAGVDRGGAAAQAV